MDGLNAIKKTATLAICIIMLNLNDKKNKCNNINIVNQTIMSVSFFNYMSISG